MTAAPAPVRRAGAMTDPDATLARRAAAAADPAGADRRPAFEPTPAPRVTPDRRSAPGLRRRARRAPALTRLLCTPTLRAPAPARALRAPAPARALRAQAPARVLRAPASAQILRAQAPARALRAH